MVKNDDTAVRVRGLSKSYGSSRILSDMDLELRKGESAVLFGPNGAGKTTLVKILAALIKPDAGEVYINGRSLKKEPQEIRRTVGVVSHEHFLYYDLTVAENLRFFGRLYGVEELSEKVDLSLQGLGIQFKKNELVRDLSNGMKQRASIARAMLHEPDVLMFDEPFAGLDNEGVSFLINVIERSRKNNKTVIVTTHNSDLGLKICDAVLMLDQGRVKYKIPAGEVSSDQLRTGAGL